TVANANFRGATVDWYIKADDIVLKNKGGQAGNPQNNAPQGQQKK
ncbi:conjugal transfer protein, partial [Clostridioides difficile]